MKLTHLALALVLVGLDPRTETDHRRRLLDTAPYYRIVAKHFGYSVEHADNGLLYVTGLACGEENCGATWNDLEAHPAIRYDSRGASYPGSPERSYCTVCSGSRRTASTLSEQLCTKNVAQTLDLWSITRLPEIDFTAVRCGGKTVVTAGSFQQAAQAVTPKRVDLESEFEAVLARACSLDVATEAVRSDSFPADAFVVVPLQHTLWPKAAWHDQPQAMTDSAPIRAYEKQHRREAEQAIEAEVQQFRSELAQRQRGA
jgi:uncharacterized protein (DUF2237 family)